MPGTVGGVGVAKVSKQLILALVALACQWRRKTYPVQVNKVEKKSNEYYDRVVPCTVRECNNECSLTINQQIYLLEAWRFWRGSPE